MYHFEDLNNSPSIFPTIFNMQQRKTVLHTNNRAEYRQKVLPYNNV